MIKYINLLIIIGLSEAKAKADVAEFPIGKRQYLLENKIPYAPVAIQSIDEARPKTQGVMRDPIPLGSKPLLLKGEAGHKTVIAPKRISKMVFDQVAVKGRYLVPRVSFDRPILDIDRSEEPVQVNYRAKIKESESILKNLDW